MLAGRASGTSGRTRICPHCKATILESAPVCPQCRHHLRFLPGGATVPKPEGFTALRVEGTLEHDRGGGDWEYSVVMSIRNEQGVEVARQVVGVGALRPSESRTFSLSVEVLTPAGRSR